MDIQEVNENLHLNLYTSDPIRATPTTAKATGDKRKLTVFVTSDVKIIATTPNGPSGALIPNIEAH